MARGLMALLAHPWRAHLEQVVVHGAMRVVADRAVLLYRLVRAHERPALLHVAGVAGVVDAVAHQVFRPCGAVGIVAIRARDLAFAQRVARRTVDLRAHLLVTVEAHLGLRDLIAHHLVGDVDLVAVSAGDIARRVRAAAPVDALATLMARKTWGVAFLDRRSTALAGDAEVALDAVLHGHFGEE